MKELIDSIWNAPKEDIVSFLSQTIIVGLIVTVIVWVLIYLWIKKDL